MPFLFVFVFVFALEIEIVFVRVVGARLFLHRWTDNPSRVPSQQRRGILSFIALLFATQP